MVVITASDAMQYSFEGGQQVGEPPGPSPFTQALVDGLRTGEADQDEDGNVSINELFDYLERRVRETSPSQTPTKSAVNQTGDWVIARTTRVPSVKLLPERVQLLLKSGEPIDRLDAIIDLERIRSSSDKRTAQAATAAIQALTTDDSRRVAQRATQALGSAPPAAAVPAAILATARNESAHPSLEGQVSSNDSPISASEIPRRTGLPPFALDMARGVARALLGSLIGIVIGVVFALTSFDANPPATSSQILGAIVGIVVGSTIVATLIELLRLRFLVRNVPLLTAVAANRWAEAATVGIVVSAIAAALNEGGAFNALANVAGTPLTLLILTTTQVLGFLLAEAVVGSARPHAAPGSAGQG